VYRVLVGKPEGKRPLGRPRCRWVDNIRMDLQEVGCGYMEWIALAQDRDRWRTLVSAVMNLGGSVKRVENIQKYTRHIKLLQCNNLHSHVSQQYISSVHAKNSSTE